MGLGRAGVFVNVQAKRSFVQSTAEKQVNPHVDEWNLALPKCDDGHRINIVISNPSLAISPNSPQPLFPYPAETRKL
ncbi:hypothetical protein U2F10_21790 [Leptothoe sp. EHU-05/26/07-4]